MDGAIVGTSPLVFSLSYPHTACDMQETYLGAGSPFRNIPLASGGFCILLQRMVGCYGNQVPAVLAACLFLC